MALDRQTFTARNGTKLDDLVKKQGEALARLDAAVGAVREAEAEIMGPLRLEEQRARSAAMNVDCLLNSWWREFKSQK